ncbi:MAG TPA: FGGY family carbohydrate kinase [Polyangiaceae bacterium]|nr:FGGY family carbohydrate kinase [Polyangiaceae bacterium]
MSTYLAIDIGTTSAKAALYDLGGELLASRSADYPLHQPHPGWAEQDPNAYWEATQALCGALLALTRNPPVQAVCVSGQAPSCLPINRAGEPLRKALLWLDRRATREVDLLRDRLGVEEAAARSGNTLDGYFGGPKCLWFRANEPELWKGTHKILQANGFIIHRLTGEAVTDPSHAGLMSPFYNASARAWDPAVCDLFDLPLDRLPAIHPSTSIVGHITRSAADATGIPAGTPVVCGGGDFACACLGAGVSGGGSAAMMLGTAGNLLVPGPGKNDPRLINTVHVTGEPLRLGGVMAGGAVRWFGDMLRVDEPDLFAALDAEAEAVPAGASGLIFLPYLLGERTPIWDPHARGAFIGLSGGHHRGHLFRAVLEGVAFAFRQMNEIVGEAGAPVREVIAVNGGAKSALWRRIFADVLGVPVRYRPASGGTVLGAAYLARVGAGDTTGFQEIEAWLERPIDTEPSARTAAVYDHQYGVFRDLYGRLRESFGMLAGASR